MLGRGDLTAETMGKIFVSALPVMRRVLRRFDVPLGASVSANGHMRVLLVAGRLLDTPRDLR